MQKSIFEQICGTFTQVGDVLLPNLTISNTETRPLGKYGRMRKRYLEDHHPVLFSELLLSDRLFPHLWEINQTCEDRLELLVRRMARQEGVTEALKAADQMEWVRRMNSIHARAEEVVLKELVYPEEAKDADA